MASMSEKITAIRDKFKLDSHHEMERFAIMIFALAGTLAMILVTLGVSSYRNTAEILGNKAIYTESFTTSKTNMKGSVTGVYTNAAKTEVMVLMKLDNAKGFSQDPNKYQAFVTGSNSKGILQDMKDQYTGKIGIFGGTGYIALFLNSEKPIQSDVLAITFRSTSQLIPDGTSEAKEAAIDKSFATYDQWRVYANPGANDATVLPALNSDNIDLGNIYYETVVSEQEVQMRDELDDQLEQMQIALRACDEYETQLLNLSTVDGIKVVPMDRPNSIAGDEVTGTAKVKHVGEDGQPQSSTDSDDPLRLHTDAVLPGGFEFNWQDGSIKEGYIKNLLEPEQTYADFLSKKSVEEQDSNVESVTSANPQWILSDGSVLADHEKGGPLESLFNQTNLVVQSWQNYYQLKSAYEKTSLKDMLTLEYNYLSVLQNGSLSTDKDSVITY